MTSLRFTPFQIAAGLMNQYKLELEDAFLGPWYIYDPDTPVFSYYYARARIMRVNLAYIPLFTIKQMEAAVEARKLGPNPWPIYRVDPTYCRVCFRYKIYRRLRCRYCTIQLRVYDRPRAPIVRLCRVPGCGEPHLSLGRCRRHYQQAYRSGLLWRPPEEHDLPIDWNQLVL